MRVLIHRSLVANAVFAVGIGLLLSIELGLRAQTADSLDPQASASVACLAVQADGKVLVGGSFNSLGGTGRNFIARLNPDGMLDHKFNPVANGLVSGLGVQTDSKIIAVGSFTAMGGRARKLAARLNIDGSLDEDFDPVFSIQFPSQMASCVLIQPDGAILVGGGFGLVRLEPDGSLDSSFSQSIPNGVNALALQPDGKVIVGGSFYGPHFGIARVNADGSLDVSFDPGIIDFNWDYRRVNTLAIQPDGKVIVAGAITALGGQKVNNLGRLNTDGTLDATFRPELDYPAYTLALLANGKILVGGNFLSIAQQPQPKLALLNPDGTLDASFSPGADGDVGALAVQTDGKVLVGGSFSELGGQPRGYLGRLTPVQPATQELSYSGGIRWLRGGSSPQVWRTSFAASTNGDQWIELGDGLTIPGGWQAAAPGWPPETKFRARGFVTGCGSSQDWFVESLSGPALIRDQPESRTLDLGVPAFLSVIGDGTPPLNFQWFKGGMPLTNSSNVVGSQSPTLILRNPSGADLDNYTVVVSNSFGSVTSQPASLRVNDPIITLHPNSQAANPGDDVTFVVKTKGTAPLAYQWRRDGIEIPTATGTSVILTNIQTTDRSVYDVVVTGAFGTATSSPARLVQPVVLDSLNPGPDNKVTCLAIQPDGRLLVGGKFSNVGNQPLVGLARFNPDGSLDPTFGRIPRTIASLALLEDGRILVGMDSQGFKRLFPDGSADPSLQASAPTSLISCWAPQADGSVILGEGFNSLFSKIERVNTDGAFDSKFTAQADGGVLAIATEDDGRLLIAGTFFKIGQQSRDQSRACIGGLNADSTVDPIFNPGAYGPVFCLTIQPDKKVLVAGNTLNLDGEYRYYIGRVNPWGDVDLPFNPFADGQIYCLALQADGKILIGGAFTHLSGRTCNHLGRLNPDGSVDTTFTASADGNIYALAIDQEGSIVVGGLFHNLNGTPRSCLGRFRNTDPPTQMLSYSSSTITWTRGGTSPEVWRTTFDQALGGTNWTRLGNGVRIPGGWQLSGLSLGANPTIRARGFIAAGGTGYSHSFTEAITGPPALNSQAGIYTNNAGDVVRFRVSAGGTAPLAYQWYKDGSALNDDGRLLSTRTPELTVSNLTGWDAGIYSVSLSNFLGAVSAPLATLTVVDPYLLSQSTGQTASPGNDVTLSAQLAGAEPMVYQWQKDGTNLPAAAAASLHLANVQRADAGDYQLLVTNRFGNVRSAVIPLTVNLGTADSLRVEADNHIYAMALQPDGRIVVAGSFSTLAGQPRSRIGRLNADGSLDNSFVPVGDGDVYCLGIQPDGKILVGGGFFSFAGQPRTNLARLNIDGSLDESFDPSPDGVVYCICLRADSTILLGGRFWTLGGQTHPGIALLNTDGTPEGNFNTSAGPPVRTIATRPNGKLAIGGDFTVPLSYLAGLNADGTSDPTFNRQDVFNCFTTHPNEGYVYCLSSFLNDEVLAGGYLVPSLTGFVWLDPDGTPKTNVVPSLTAVVYSSLVQADAKLILAGSFWSWGAAPRNYLDRFNADGTVNNVFAPALRGPLDAAALQKDGKILLAGEAGTTNGQTIYQILRVNNTDPAIDKLALQGSTISWSRGGVVPEISSAGFSFTTNGVDWVYLGPGVRTPDGWQLAGVSTPPNCTLRAHAYTSGGYQNGSTWFIESSIVIGSGSPPRILIDGNDFGVNSNRFGFRAVGTPGQTVLLEGSTDFVNWLTLRTNILSSDPVYFTDPDFLKFDRRFYRLRVRPD